MTGMMRMLCRLKPISEKTIKRGPYSTARVYDNRQSIVPDQMEVDDGNCGLDKAFYFASPSTFVVLLIPSPFNDELRSDLHQPSQHKAKQSFIELRL